MPWYNYYISSYENSIIITIFVDNLFLLSPYLTEIINLKK